MKFEKILPVLCVLLCISCATYAFQIKEVKEYSISNFHAGKLFAFGAESMICWDNTGYSSGITTLDISNGNVTRYPEIKYVATTDRFGKFLLHPENPSDWKNQNIDIINLGKKTEISKIVRIMETSKGHFSFFRISLPDMQEIKIDSSLLDIITPKLFLQYQAFSQYGYIIGDTVFFCVESNGSSEIFCFTLDQSDTFTSVQVISSDVPYLKPLTAKLFVGASFVRYTDPNDVNSTGEWVLTLLDASTNEVHKSNIIMVGKEDAYLDNVFICLSDGKTVVYAKEIIKKNDISASETIVYGIIEITK